ncbi:(2Fe-2S)-binding protein [Paraburkholderia antibiotica]|uniref:(2Fe-2S)-binding protein n=1 Tax=Paraburkholderia antibiotica TaxID=2728839 RepID=A0A7X9X7R8_9BURK|nr:(2Fe-2S)-binding protein [Paraburkholderia antibiotica]NML32644.1 (2Fe-2S)-binding protein [Paraburkholderia antibiotica]
MTHDDAARIRLTIDGRSVEVDSGTTVAAALAMAGVNGSRRSVGGEPRAPLCGMGVCQECRVTIDGHAHTLACQTLCREGQRVDTSNGMVGV